MKKLYLLIAGAAICTTLGVFHANAATPDIYGSMVANNSWSAWDKAEGIYVFQPTEGTEVKEVFTDDYDLGATGGGVLVDDIYHIFSDRGGGSTFSVSYTSYHIDNWSVDYSCYFSNIIVSHDMTYDQATDRVYCAQASKGKGKLTLWNPNIIDDINTVAEMDVEIVAIAINAEGTLYGIGTDGILYSIDKTDGSLSLVGDTGVAPKGYQSAVFDYAGGDLYWAMGGALYKVDTQNGEAQKVTDFKDKAEFCGLYIIGASCNDDAPAAVTDLNVSAESGSNDVNITFTMPKTTYGGTELAGNVAYKVDVDGQNIAGGNAAAGESISIDITVATGEHMFTVIPSNEAGDGPRAKFILYVGKAVPGAPDRAKATPTETPNEIIVSWKAPDYWMPWDAYFDPKELTYEVMRMPGETIIASGITECTVTDVIDYTGPLTSMYYLITPMVDDIRGAAAQTNSVSVGEALTPPFEAVMATADLGTFTIIDANNDGTTWGKDFYGYGVSCGGRWDGDCDDWLILPALALENTGLYHTIITVGNDYDGPSKWELKIGKRPTVEAMNQTIMEEASTVTSYEGDIRVSESGTYYIGIHCIGAAGSTMYVTNIIVRNESNLEAPDAPIKVSGVGAEKGELAAYVTFTTPSMSIGGNRLDELTTVNIYHGEKLVYTLEGVEIDSEYTCKVEADQEFNTYEVAAVNEYGEGRRARVEYVFAGVDYPDTVTNFTLTEDASGKPKLTWDPSTETGVYGYYVDPSAVRYLIYRGYGNDSYDIVEEAFDGTEYVDNGLDADCKQFMLQYYIYPINQVGRGYGCASNVMCYGKPFPTPFVENFPNGESSMSPWYFHSTNRNNTAWTIYRNEDTSLSDYDGSNGLMAFNATESGDEATLCAPYISIEGTTNPILDFYYYNDGNTVPVEVMVNGQAVANDAKINDKADWQRFKASLAGFANARRIELTFKAQSDGGLSYAFIDNIRVREQFDNDMAVASIQVPATMDFGENCDVNVAVKNDGETPAAGVSVQLIRNGYVVDQTEIASIDAAEQQIITFRQTPDVTFGDTPTFQAVVKYEFDQNETNDASEEVASSIKAIRYPAPTGLEALSENGVVTLKWEAPTQTTLAPEPITDDFEDYEAFTTDLYPWSTVDGDLQETSIMSDPIVWYEYLDYPHAGEPTAFQVFNPSEVGIDTDYYIFYAPHSGSQALVSWSTNDFSTCNDDWLISPELFEGGQTISFWVYSRTGYWYSEKYEVLYSPFGTETGDFILLESGIAYNEWTCVEVELPEDAKYFAIHNVTDMSTTEIWFDDITYIPATKEAIPLDLLGYNLYRDNVRINAELLTTETCTDAAIDGEHKYNVTAVYGVGESALSESAKVDNGSGVASVGADRIKVTATKGYIHISGAEGQNCSVYTPSGIMVDSRQPQAATYSIPVSAGVYVVTVNERSFKVYVK